MQYLVQQYGTWSCPGNYPGVQFYSVNFSFNNTGMPNATPDGSMYQGNLVADDGTPFFGEAASNTVYGAGHGENEPVFVANPVAGQHIHTHAALYGACGSPQANTPTGATLDTDFYVVQHYTTWGRWHDVWIITLVEQPGTPNARYYFYAYAVQDDTQQGGSVAFACVTQGQDYYDCGNYYESTQL